MFALSGSFARNGRSPQHTRYRGMSGASHLRPGYQTLLEGARKGEFDIVLAEALEGDVERLTAQRARRRHARVLASFVVKAVLA